MTLEIWWREGACPGREEGWRELPVKPDAPYALVANLQPHKYSRAHKYTKAHISYTRSHGYTLFAALNLNINTHTRTHWYPIGFGTGNGNTK